MAGFSGMRSSEWVIWFNGLVEIDLASLLPPGSLVSSIRKCFLFNSSTFDLRLKDETKVTSLITKLQSYLEERGSPSDLCRIYIRYINHIYYKVNSLECGISFLEVTCFLFWGVFFFQLTGSVYKFQITWNETEKNWTERDLNLQPLG